MGVYRPLCLRIHEHGKSYWNTSSVPCADSSIHAAIHQIDGALGKRQPAKEEKNATNIKSLRRCNALTAECAPGAVAHSYSTSALQCLDGSLSQAQFAEDVLHLFVPAFGPARRLPLSIEVRVLSRDGPGL